MTHLELKILLLQKQQQEPDKDWSVTAIAERIGCRRQELSMTIRQVKGRTYPWIRAAFAKELGTNEEALFGTTSKAAKAA
jgi:hypothetical protein